MDEVTVVGHPVVDARRAGTRIRKEVRGQIRGRVNYGRVTGLPTTPVDEPASTDRTANEAG